MPPQDPNVGAPGAPAQPTSAQPTTSRPDPNAIAAFRMAQSANDRATHLSNQLGTVTNLVQGLVNSQQANNDEQFYDRLGQQFTNGDIDQAAYTRKVAERTAQRYAMQSSTPAAPTAPAPASRQQADPQDEAQRAKTYGARAIVQGLGLSMEQPGLDFSSPQALMQSGQRILSQQGQEQQSSSGGTSSVNVNDQLGEIARQQGYVIPHRDGGRPAGAHPQATEADLDAIVWDKKNAHAPKRRVDALQSVRDSLAARTPSMRTGEGLLGSPNTFRER